MANCTDGSTKGNLVDINMIFLLFATVFLLSRVWMDVFILTVNLRDWMKKKHLNTTDRILTLQGSIRICLGIMLMIRYTLEEICPWIIQRSDIPKIIRFSSWYFISYNVWLMASLCSYYCVKIADFSHPFFIHLKLRLSGLESAWLIGSAVLALGSSLPFVFHELGIKDYTNFSHILQNKNVTDISDRTIALHIHVLLALGYVAAFSVCATSAALLLFSLWRHRQRMLGSWGGHRSPQTEAHFQAVIIILSFLVNSVVVFICIQLMLSKYSTQRLNSHIVASIVLYSSFSVESLISIWGNKKLKNVLCRASYVIKCRGCVR